MDDAITACGNAKIKVRDIPVIGGGLLTLNYQGPINANVGLSAFPSTFINTLGSHTTLNSLTYALYKVV